MIYLDPVTYSEIRKRSEEMKIPLSTLIRSIIIEWLAKEKTPGENEEIEELKKRHLEIEQREQEIGESMRRILEEIRKIAQEHPELSIPDQNDVIDQVKSAIALRPMTMREVVKVTNLSETQTIIALSHLIETGTIFLDPDYRYRLRR